MRTVPNAVARPMNIVLPNHVQYDVVSFSWL
jgi:hypothetical protein